MKQYEREFAKLTPQEKEATMELMTSWERKGREEGRQEGRQEGKEDLLVRQINKRLGSVPSEMIDRLDRLSADQLNELGVALFDFASVSDLEKWLSRHNAQ